MLAKVLAASLGAVIALPTLVSAPASADIVLGGMSAVIAGRAALVHPPDTDLELVVSFGSRVYCRHWREVVSADGMTHTPLNSDAVISSVRGLLAATSGGSVESFPSGSTIGKATSCGVVELGHPTPPQYLDRTPDVVAPFRPAL